MKWFKCFTGVQAHQGLQRLLFSGLRNERFDVSLLDLAVITYCYDYFVMSSKDATRGSWPYY